MGIIFCIYDYKGDKEILLDLRKKDLREKKICVLDNNFYLSNILLDNICDEKGVNYLSLITERKDLYKKKWEEVFSETGLNMEILGLNREIIKNADIIINNDFGLEIDFLDEIKKDVIYFDLSERDKKFSEKLKAKRKDIFVFDKINLLYNKKVIDNNLFEMILYCADKNFKKILDGKYSKKICQDVKKSFTSLT